MAAWTAFLLCRQLSRRVAPALAGGLLFGFGTYESVETVNHLNLALVALVPLAVLLVLRRYAGRALAARASCSRSGVLLGAAVVDVQRGLRVDDRCSAGWPS